MSHADPPRAVPSDAELAHLRPVALAAYRAVDSALLSHRPSAATWREQCKAVMAYIDWANANGVEIDPQEANP